MSTTPRSRAIAVFLLTFALALTGCGAKESQMTPERARDSLIKIAEDTAALLDIDGWKDEVSLAQGCSAGVEFGYTYAAPPADSVCLAEARKVAEYWRSLGMETRVNSEMTRSSSEAAAPFRASASPRAQGCTTSLAPPFACPATPTITADASAYPCGHEPWSPSTRRSATRSSVSTGFLVPYMYFGVHAQTSPCRHGSVGSGNGSACRGLRRRLR